MNGTAATTTSHLIDATRIADDFDVKTAAAILKLMGNSDRLRVLNLLLKGDKRVAEIEETLNMRQPLVSQALQRLRQDGLVDFRKSGKFVIYSLANKNIHPILTEIRKRFPSGLPAGAQRQG